MSIALLSGDARDVLPTLAANSVHTCVTSPPYYALRSYLDAAHPDKHREIGSESTPDEYLATMVAVFREVRRVLRPDGTLWLNVGDSFSGGNNVGWRPGNPAKNGGNSNRDGVGSVPGLAAKQLLMMPARLALALQADGWWVRSDIIWAKPNPMPESVTDRPTSAHEHVFLLTKSSRYFYDAEAVREDVSGGAHSGRSDGDVIPPRGGVDSGGARPSMPRELVNGRNLRNVWTIATHAFSEWTPSHELVPVLASEVQERGASKNAGGRDTARITSPDCPLHAGQPDSVPKGFYDGLSADQVSRTRDTVGRHVPGTHPGSSTTQHTPVRSNSRPSRTSCSDPEGAASAMPHSTESHRTAHGPLSSEHAMSSEETASDTPRTAQSPCSPASIDHGTAESRTEGDNSDGCAPETAAGTVHKSACQCGYYRKVTTKTSHFATYPPELAERCIRAGTSERGCCSACGAPWRRETDTSYERNRHGHSGRTDASGSNGWDGGAYPNLRKLTTTTGWAASCACAANATSLVNTARHGPGKAGCDGPASTQGGRDDLRPGVIPCTVLDPFAGAGTTLLVADRLQRNAIGVELNAAYTEMAMERCRADAPLFADTPEPQPAPGFAQADLFAEAAD